MPTVEQAMQDATAIKADASVDFVIDKDMRTIAIPTLGVILGVTNDKDTNAVRFEMPRYYKGVDLSKFSCHVSFRNAAGVSGAYIVNDISASDDLMSFTWLVSALACQTSGEVSFSVNFTELSGSDVKRRYGSTIATATVLDNIDSDEVVDADARSDLMALLDSRTQDALTAAKTANRAVLNAETATASANAATDSANHAAEVAASSAKANASMWLDYDPEGFLCIYESEGD